MYWLQLELDTTRKAKSSVEDRMAEMYRDMQMLQDNDDQVVLRRPVLLTAEYITSLHAQLDKYERMFRISDNQISIVRSSSDEMVKSLKSEISELMEEKCRMEMQLMNKLTDLEGENRKLKDQIHLQPTPTKGLASLMTEASAPRHETVSGESTAAAMGRAHETAIRDSDLETSVLQTEFDRLKRENDRLLKLLKDERCDANDTQTKWKRERATLADKISRLQEDLSVLRTASGVDQILYQQNREKEETLQSLDRVSLLWDRADESIHNLENVMTELQGRGSGDAEIEHPKHRDQQERLLSTLETASLVHGQVKVSLMLIELKLRNNLACLSNDNLQSALDNDSDINTDRVQEVTKQAMAAIADIEQKVDEKLKQLKKQSELETHIVRDALQSKVHDLSQMQLRQAELETQLAQLRSDNNMPQIPEQAISGNDDEVFVSRTVLEKLQNEVLQVVERVQEKNEEIGRLTATVEEHKIRERSLMDELKRHMKEQGERQLLEQQRLIEQARMQPDSSDDEEYASSEYEEVYEEESLYDEETVYEEA